MNQTFKTKAPETLFSIDLSNIGLNESQIRTIESTNPASLSDEKLQDLKIPGLSPIQNQSVIETIMGHRKYAVSHALDDTTFMQSGPTVPLDKYASIIDVPSLHTHNKTKRHRDTSYIERKLEKSLKKIITAVALGIIIIIFQLTMGIR